MATTKASSGAMPSTNLERVKPDADEQNAAAAASAAASGRPQFFSNMQAQPESKDAAAEKAKNDYPKMVYGKDGASRIVADAEAEGNLDGTWHDSPVKAGGKETAPAAKAGAVPVNAPSLGMPTLPENHTYRDRVEAEARHLGIEVKSEETLEYLMWKIRMVASS